MYEIIIGIVFNEITIINLIFILWSIQARRPKHYILSFIPYAILTIPISILQNMYPDSRFLGNASFYACIVMITLYSLIFSRVGIVRSFLRAFFSAAIYTGIEILIGLPVSLQGIQLGENFYADLYLLLALPPASFIVYRIGLKKELRCAVSKYIPAACSVAIMIIAAFFLLLDFKSKLVLDHNLMQETLIILLVAFTGIYFQAKDYARLRQKDASIMALKATAKEAFLEKNAFECYAIAATNALRNVTDGNREDVEKDLASKLPPKHSYLSLLAHKDVSVTSPIINMLVDAPNSLNITADTSCDSATISCDITDFYIIVQILFRTVFDNYCNDRMHVILGKKVLDGVDRFSLCAKVSHDKLDEAQVFEKPKDKKLRKSSMYYARKIAKSYDGDLRLENGDNGTVSFTLII